MKFNQLTSVEIPWEKAKQFLHQITGCIRNLQMTGRPFFFNKSFIFWVQTNFTSTALENADISKIYRQCFSKLNGYASFYEKLTSALILLKN